MKPTLTNMNSKLTQTLLAQSSPSISLASKTAPRLTIELILKKLKSKCNLKYKEQKKRDNEIGCYKSKEKQNKENMNEGTQESEKI